MTSAIIVEEATALTAELQALEKEAHDSVKFAVAAVSERQITAIREKIKVLIS